MGRANVFCAALACAALSPSPASASGFLVARFGGEHGNVTSDHVSTLYYNPAGLALDTGTRVYVEGLFGYRSVTYERPVGAIDNVVDTTGEAGTPLDAVSANSGKASLFNPVASPFAAVASDLGIENLGVAVGLSVPFGGGAQWDKNDEYADSTQYPGAVDGVQRWQNIEGATQSLYITAAGAYRIPSANLSVGLGVNVVRTTLDTIRARNASGADHLVSGSGGLQEGRARVSASGTHLSVGVGVNWQPIDSLWVAASYQSRPGFGDTTLSGTLRTKLGIAPESEGALDQSWNLPDVARFGARYRLNDKIEIRGWGEFVHWSVVDKHCGTLQDTGDGCEVNADGTAADGSSTISFNIPRDWKNTIGFRAGGSYWLDDRTELYVGAGWDPSAIPDERLDSALLDLPKITASLGGRLAVNDNISVAATYTQVVYFSKTIEPRERDGNDDVIAPFEPPSLNPDDAGTYSSSIGILILGAQYAF